MKTSLNQKSVKVFKRLLAQIPEGETSVIIANSDVFMPVHVDIVEKGKAGLQVSIAHYRRVSGDLVQDPEILFLFKEVSLPSLKTGDIVKKGIVTPIFYQDGFKHDPISFLDEHGDVQRFFPKKMRSCLEFANMWMSNISNQQF